MAELRAFRALRPRPEIAARVAAPPYDVVDVAEARALAGTNPDSFLHVSRPEIDLPDGADPAAVHARGRWALADLVRRGVLTPDQAPTLSVYRQQRQGREQTGVVAAATVADYRSGVIAVHERTRPDKEDDRTEHLDALSAHDEPVFLMSPDRAEIDELVAGVTGAGPRPAPRCSRWWCSRPGSSPCCRTSGWSPTSPDRTVPDMTCPGC